MVTWIKRYCTLSGWIIALGFLKCCIELMSEIISKQFLFDFQNEQILQNTVVHSWSLKWGLEEIKGRGMRFPIVPRFPLEVPPCVAMKVLLGRPTERNSKRSFCAFSLCCTPAFACYSLPVCLLWGGFMLSSFLQESKAARVTFASVLSF